MIDTQLELSSNNRIKNTRILAHCVHRDFTGEDFTPPPLPASSPTLPSPAVVKVRLHTDEIWNPYYY